MRCALPIVVVAVGSACTPDSNGPAVGASNAFGETALWTVDSETTIASSSQTFTALVFRLDCSSGETGEVFGPSVETTSDEIVVTFTTAALDPAGGYDCPGNDHVPVEVDLDEARGDRPIVDGGCRDRSAASTLLCRSEVRRVDTSGSPLPFRN